MTEEARNRDGSVTGSLSTMASFADDSVISISSTDLNASVFSDFVLSDDQTDILSITPSISDTVEIDYENRLRMETPLSRVYNILGRRFEKVIGASSYSNDVVKVSVVSYFVKIRDSRSFSILKMNLGH